MRVGIDYPNSPAAEPPPVNGLNPGNHDAPLPNPPAVEPGWSKFTFALDPVDSRPGAPVFNRVITLKDTWAQTPGARK